MKPTPTLYRKDKIHTGLSTLTNDHLLQLEDKYGLDAYNIVALHTNPMVRHQLFKIPDQKDAWLYIRRLEYDNFILNFNHYRREWCRYFVKDYMGFHVTYLGPNKPMASVDKTPKRSETYKEEILQKYVEDRQIHELVKRYKKFRSIEQTTYESTTESAPTPASAPDSDSASKHPKYKTEMCRYFPYCRNKEMCNFAHSESELRYCNLKVCRYDKGRSCKWGDKCQFKHLFN